jgi:hypothetical protein
MQHSLPTLCSMLWMSPKLQAPDRFGLSVLTIRTAFGSLSRLPAPGGAALRVAPGKLAFSLRSNRSAPRLKEDLNPKHELRSVVI